MLMASLRITLGVLQLVIMSFGDVYDIGQDSLAARVRKFFGTWVESKTSLS